MATILSLEQLKQSLHNPEWLRSFHWYEEVDSTNSLARKIVSDGYQALPALIVAEQQTQGRGRGSHAWWSPRGCLMMTLAVPSRLLPEDRSRWGQLALLTGVAVGEAVESIASVSPVQLKWPNDLYLNGRKAAGILIESLSDIQKSIVFLIGIGINVSIDWKSAPDELQDRATCLSSFFDLALTPVGILPKLLNSFSHRLERWRIGQDDWHDFWTSRCYLTGRNIVLKTPSPSEAAFQGGILGRCEGVAPDGQLLLRTELGRVLPYNVGEVQVLDETPKVQ